MTQIYFMMACMHIGLLTGLTLAIKSSFKLTALIFVGSLVWPILLGGFFYLKWCGRKGARS
ncbi:MULTISPECIES: hypothetical protein [Pseudomonadota]|uniref:Uncharacterized protein n=2 Tax=Pseudomonadota TaxID=1224 RepID=A0A096F4M0_COMTE|nr:MULTISPECIES: hypothetical protein [Pseudomonadota]KGH24693.1 hypothetical protein P353_26415 [Comamonas testosteroni]HJH21615.1 hypothetical protein [Pseudomonas lactis]